jgi:hypothetical protein
MLAVATAAWYLILVADAQKITAVINGTSTKELPVMLLTDTVWHCLLTFNASILMEFQEPINS